MVMRHSTNTNSELNDDEKLNQIRDFWIRGTALGLHKSVLLKLFISHEDNSNLVERKPCWKSKMMSCFGRSRQFKMWNLCAIVIIVIATLMPLAFVPIYNYAQLWPNFETLVACVAKCKQLQDIFRPKMSCAICANLTEVPVVTKISREDFDRFYAYSSVPVKVKGAATQWKAVSTFNLRFFKSFYLDNPKQLDPDCYFISFGASVSDSVRTLKDLMNLSNETLDNLVDREGWYIGWQNCKELNGDARLSDFFEKPDFLGNINQGNPDRYPWIFIGTHGRGVGFHTDSVNLPTWQAQLRGSKTWTLIPDYECLSVCPTINVTLDPGDLLVLDTNLWYHSTFIHPGDISVSVGEEFY